MLVGSYPVYDCVLYSKSESGPPGQYTQIFPVVAICGHRCGFDITATTAIPEAVRTGFARSLGSSDSRSDSGSAAIISTSFGARASPYFRQAADLIEFRSTVWFFLESSTMEFTISAIARTRASSSVRPWAWKPPRPGRGCFFGSGAMTAVAIVNTVERKDEGHSNMLNAKYRKDYNS